MFFRQLFPERGMGDDVLDEIDVGVLRVKAGYDAGQVRAAWSGSCRRRAGVHQTRIRGQERHFWETSTPIGYIFWLGTLMGFIVGAA